MWGDGWGCPGPGWRRQCSEKSCFCPKIPLEGLEPGSGPGQCGGGGSGVALGPHAAQRGTDPVHVEGYPCEEVGKLAGGTSPDHKGVYSLDDAVTDQGAT